MDANDTSDLYLLTKRYLEEFPLSKEQVLREYKAFIASNAHVLSRGYVPNKDICKSRVAEDWGTYISAMSEAGGWSSDEQCEIYTQRQKEFQMVCLKLREENKNSNPFEVSPVKSKSTVVLNTEVHADGGMIKSSVTAGVSKVCRCAGPVVEFSGVSEVKRKAVKHIPNYHKGMSCSKEECYDALKKYCEEHEFILQGVPSPLYTTSCWHMLNYYLQLMHPNDNSQLHVLCKKYFTKHFFTRSMILKEYEVNRAKLLALIPMPNSIDKYNAMMLLDYEWPYTSASMDMVKGWKKKPVGDKERNAGQLNYCYKICTDWLKHRDSAEVQTNHKQSKATVSINNLEKRNSSAPISVARQGSTVKREQTKEPTASTSSASTKVNTHSKKLKEVSNESQWLRDFSNKYFYDSSDDEEESHSVQSSSSSSYDGYGSDSCEDHDENASDSYEDCDETVRDGSEGDAISDYGSESGWNSDHSNGDY